VQCHQFGQAIHLSQTVDRLKELERKLHTAQSSAVHSIMHQRLKWQGRKAVKQHQEVHRVSSWRTSWCQIKSPLHPHRYTGVHSQLNQPALDKAALTQTTAHSTWTCSTPVTRTATIQLTKAWADSGTAMQSDPASWTLLRW
jgi:hypothetical protein